jgi:hypothetical protein
LPDHGTFLPKPYPAERLVRSFVLSLRVASRPTGASLRRGDPRDSQLRARTYIKI